MFAPRVNNFDCALLVRDGEVKSVEKVSARGARRRAAGDRPDGSLRVKPTAEKLQS